MPSIDLNCDLGESFGRWSLGQDAEVMHSITSANVACGFHAGDPDVMRQTVRLARESGVAIGAHPGFPDLVGFGRRNINATPQEVENFVLYQLGALHAIAAAEGVKLQHVKAHGALYNMAIRDRPLSDAIARAVAAFDRSLIFFGLPGTELLKAAEAAGLPPAAEGFADRAYEPDGLLTPRSRPGSVIHNPVEVVRRAVRMAKDGIVTATNGVDIPVRVKTICTHGDTPGSHELTRLLREGLELEGIAVRAVGVGVTTVGKPTPSVTRLTWWSAGTPDARRALIAAMLGWMLDAFDVTLFAMTLPAVRESLGLSQKAGGLLGSVTLIAAAVGGLIFGRIADRYGRTRALMLSVALYSVFTAACGFAQDFWQFAAFRILLGIGMGGEWASGAALVSETWPSEHRGKALGLMQSGWAIGYAAAAAVNGIVQPIYGWRAVFFIGILPAFFTLWIRRSVKEPPIWTRASSSSAASPGLSSIFHKGLAPLTIALTFMNTCTLFAWWGFYLWLPSYLSQPTAQGGIGLNLTSSSWFIIVMQIGMWFGYISFGFISDKLGRKPTYITYLLTAAVLLFLYVSIKVPVVLLLLGPFVAFFATGYFSGFGAVTAEIYPTAIRATAQGFTYNLGRIVSALAPFYVGALAQTHGFGAALSISSAAFLLAAVTWIWIPETRGRELT